MTRWLALSIALTVAAWAVSLDLYYFRPDLVPEEVPTHWNARGEPDAFSPRGKALWAFLLMPGTMALMTLLTPLLPWLSPKQFEIDGRSNTYGYIMFIVVALMGYLHGVILWASCQGRRTIDIGGLIIGGMLLFFALLGNVLGRVRRNFYIGVRTPWTLASENVWDRTHRLSAWLFVGYGVVGLVALLAGVPAIWLFPGILVMALTPVLYSLVLYKRLERQGRL